jgi:integrase
MRKPRQTDWQPPRGITLIPLPQRPARPYGVQWRVDGKRKTKTFSTKERQIDFARSLAGAVKSDGLAALRFNEGEVREWRAFRALIGEEVNLESVAACWLKHRETVKAGPMTVSEAVAAYTEAKRAEGISSAAISHYGPIFARLEDEIGGKDVNAVTADDIAQFMAAQKGSDQTRRTRFARARALFNWLAESRKVINSPFLGMKPPKVTGKEVQILTVEQTRQLFMASAGDDQHREALGRLALEAFAGLRHDTAAQIVAGEIEADGLRIPASKIKTRKNQFLDGLPANLHAWLAWSRPADWCMTRRQYAEAKARAFVRADVPHPHNCLRHGFASYHVAAFKNPGKTAVIMCHTSQKLLMDVYRGIASEADGKAVFKITPPSP